MVIEILLFALIAGLCVQTSYTDLKGGIIYNRWVLFMGIAAAVMNAINTLASGIMPKQLLEYIITIGIAILLSLLLYHLRLWAGGDCKLYIALALAVPYEMVLTDINGIRFLFLVPAVSFLFAYLYILFESMFYGIAGKGRSKSGGLKHTGMQFVRYLKLFFVTAFVNRFVRTAIQWVPVFSGTQEFMLISCFLIIMLLLKLRITENNVLIAAIIAIDFALGIINLDYLTSGRNLFVWSAVIFVAFFRNYVSAFNYEEIKICELRPGMILSTMSSITISQSKGSSYKKISDESLCSRLTQEEIEEIDRCSKNLASVQIVKKVPMAFFLSVATWISMAGVILL